MKKVLFSIIGMFAFQMASAQAWNGQGDQKIQAGMNVWGKVVLVLKDLMTTELLTQSL
ncbi:hypothetical protein [Elizabethkingia anophelis]|uniref:hypothetical protein n=1 Tax=Elizabethkingia anophelis TaxID=1117645 RepID=UPI000442C104|nr:hypothetical protein [Elizabethkingia anophelis]CDN74272.1 exported hypothetical protein [Elizabethkingia anophelis]CDN78101.1 exported hypothetical protein [Elizabethkingia anophelis]